MILKAYSKGLYSNWFYYAPDRVLFDCGEGVTLFLKTGIFAIEKIFLSHGHVDHIAGLPALICLRESTKGDNSKPLTIYYPEQDRSIAHMRRFLDAMAGGFIKYPLVWTAVRPGDRIEVKKGRVVEAFKANHSGEQPLGFRILETRKRLKPELQQLAAPQLAEIPYDSKYDHYEANRFSYSGDTMPLSPDLFRGAEILIHDCTFLSRADRKAPLHCTADEVFATAKAAEVKHLILCHISPRYSSPRMIRALLAKVHCDDVRYDWIPHDEVFEL